MSHYLDCLRSGEWCGLCYSGRKGRAAYRGHYGFRAARPKWRDYAMALERRKGSGVGPEATPAKAELCTAGERWPNLWDFLCLPQWPDGSKREVGTLLLCFEAGMFKAWLSDKDAGQQCWLSAETMEAVLGRADAVCGGAEADWRIPKPPQGKGRR